MSTLVSCGILSVITSDVLSFKFKADGVIDRNNNNDEVHKPYRPFKCDLNKKKLEIYFDVDSSNNVLLFKVVTNLV